MVNPNPFTNAEKDSIRTYMMVPKAFATPHALLESIFDAIDNMYDGGSNADGGATQAAIRVVLAKLATVEDQIVVQESLLLGNDIEGEVAYDSARAMAVLRYISGPSYITQLASRLAFTPDDDYFSPSKVLPGNAITYRVPKY